MLDVRAMQAHLHKRWGLTFVRDPWPGGITHFGQIGRNDGEHLRLSAGINVDKHKRVAGVLCQAAGPTKRDQKKMRSFIYDCLGHVVRGTGWSNLKGWLDHNYPDGDGQEADANGYDDAKIHLDFTGSPTLVIAHVYKQPKKAS